MVPGSLYHDPPSEEQTGLFTDRRDAGVRLAGLLAEAPLVEPLVLAIPAGGLPVAIALAERLDIPLDVAVVSKITLPWNSEAGYGAVAFDDSFALNHDLVERAGLNEQQVEAGIAETRAKVGRRLVTFRGDRPLPQLTGRDVIVVDDGLASGFTLQVAIAALRSQGADRLLVAVPTAHTTAARQLAKRLDGLYCVNLHSGLSYAVAAAYRNWRDISEEEALRLLAAYRRRSAVPNPP